MTNHNQLPTSTPELSAEEREVLSIAKLNEWRSRQNSILNGLREADDSSNREYVEVFNSSVDESLDNFLHEQGIDAASPNYNEIRTLFYDARIGRDNGSGISEDAWGNSPASRGLDPNDRKSQSDVFKERIAAKLASEIDTDEAVDIAALQTEAILENAHFDVNKSRDNWAKAASKRLGRAFSIKDNDRDKIKDEYHENIQKLGKLELQAILEDDTVSAEDKNIAVITFLFDEQKRLREKTLENLKSTKVSRFVEWMNKGSVATRVAKGVGVGALAGVTGGVLAGAAGAGFIAAGAIAGSRFVKGYVAKDRHRGSKMPSKLDDVDAQNSEDTKLVLEHLSESNSPDVLSAASSRVNTFFEDDIKDEQKERRKALGVGALSVAAGAGIGYGIHAGAEWWTGKDLTVIDGFGEKTKNLLQGDGFTVDTPGEVAPDSAPEPIIGEWGPDNDYDGDGDINSEDIDKDGDGVNNVDDFAPRDPDVVDAPKDWSDISQSARWVEPGEGWYQTFKELGVPQENWAHVLEDAGPKLHEQGWAYRMDDGQWGISQPGRLPDSSLRVIANAARRDGFDLAA